LISCSLLRILVPNRPELSARVQALVLKETAYASKFHESLALTLKTLASVEVELGEREDAVALYADALAIEEHIYGKSSEVAIRTLCQMADAVAALGMHEKVPQRTPLSQLLVL
jgi:hypothetical protein